MQPRQKEKYLFELERVASVLNENGLPQLNASRFPPHGYWYLVARSLSGLKYPSSRYIDAVYRFWYDHKETLLSSMGSRESVEMVSADVAAEEFSTPLEVKVYYINSSKIYFTAPQQHKTSIVEAESSETSACTVREEIEVTIMFQLFPM